MFHCVSEYMTDQPVLTLLPLLINIPPKCPPLFFFSSPEPKALVSSSDQKLSVVVIVVVVNFSYFHLLLQNHWANFNQTWHKASLGEGNSSFSNEGPCPFSRGDNYEMAKIHWHISKIFSSTNTGPISTKFGTNHLWVKGFKIVQMKGSILFKGDIIKK